jgi:amino acid adenylation domain-containing protein
MEDRVTAEVASVTQPLPGVDLGRRADEPSEATGGAGERGWIAPAAQCLHELFEISARRTPDAVAVVWGTDEVTYAELDRRAEAVARRLAELGVAPESCVGLCVERSPALLAAILGILKAGGAYVPLDPRYPADRLAFMVEHSQMQVAVLGSDLDVALRVRHVVRVPKVDDRDDRDDAPRARRIASRVCPDNAAVVIFTSGSTGRPKGVCLEHRSLTNRVSWQAQAFPDDAFEGVLAAASVCFDASVAEIFAALSRGGRVILADSALDLANLPRRGDVVAIDIVPSVMANLVDLGQLPRSLRYVVLAGERATDELVQRIYALPHIATVYDEYGPTEATVSVTRAERARGAGSVETIGRPIAGARIYVLDGDGAPVPAGVIGEIYIGGIVLARGYLHQPGLTAERFVPDPYAGVPGARAYRTGDAGRWRSDGRLEFHGRLDDQVKVRGFRIELQEIETVLGEHPSVGPCAVVARDDARGDKQLVAYLGARHAEPTGIDVAAVRAHLRARLPEHMVPSAWVVLAAFPVLPNGKLDRNALPAPVRGRARIDQPMTRAEQLIVRCWCDLLGVDAIGLDDSFFELGGHSLLAQQLVNRLAQWLQVDLPLAVVLATPTPAGMVAAIAHTIGGRETLEAVADLLAGEVA